ncbi:hypothetical protein [Lacipirellula limnantheis]|uniref:EamA-like transporter family protein n=1 Tax=Lacipirellula limnantheis TaxID=2528024 RepID=A0A517U332_9BACT|nr:hypothetical protein [Lacipirellula limnantheis]QDT75034.1 hypothetical protein I41_42420 [Lacipirellula limnantheis]
MRSMLLVVASFALTILCWGMYGPVLHHGVQDMSTGAGLARMRPFVCVGLAYFLIGVLVPMAMLAMKGEKGTWTVSGIVMSLGAGALGAGGALGIILALTFGGDPIFVMPLVFGGAPVVNSFLTIYLAGKMRDIGPFFLAGLVMVIMGAVVVMTCAPQKKKASAPAVTVAPVTSVDAVNAPAPAKPTLAARGTNYALLLGSIATAIVCWGAYGPTLHKGQAAMMQSRLRPFICVGLAYFIIAVIVPNIILAVSPEPSEYNVSGTMWSLLAGAAGAFGALGIIMAFNFGGKPVFVMPLIFGGAPVVSTLITTKVNGLWGDIGAFFLAGLMLVIAGAAMVLVFAPKPHPPAPAPQPVPEPKPIAEEKQPTAGGEAGIA